MKRVVFICMLFSYSFVLPMPWPKFLQKKERRKKPVQAQPIGVLEQFLPTVLVDLIGDYCLPELAKTITFATRIKNHHLDARGRLLMLSFKQKIQMHDLVTGNELDDNIPHQDPNYAENDLCPDGSVILSNQRYNSSFSHYDRATKAWKNSNPSYKFFEVHYSRTGKYIGAFCEHKKDASNNISIANFDATSGKLLATKVVDADGWGLPVMAWNHDDTMCAIAGCKGSISLLSTDFKTTNKTLSVEGGSRTTSMSFSTQGNLLATASRGEIYLWECTTGSLRWLRNWSSWTNGVGFGRNNLWIAVSDISGRMAFINSDTQQVLCQYSSHNDAHDTSDHAVASRDGNTIVTCHGKSAYIFMNPIQYLKHCATLQKGPEKSI